MRNELDKNILEKIFCDMGFKNNRDRMLDLNPVSCFILCE